MESAIFGFLGVLIGALITAGSQYIVAKRGEDAARDRDRKARVVEVKMAARLVDANLRRAAALENVFVAKRRWWDPDTVILSDEAWARNRQTLAAALPWSDWQAVSVAMLAVNHLSISRALAAELGTADKEMAIGAAEQFTPMFRDVWAGVDALHAFTQDGDG